MRDEFASYGLRIGRASAEGALARMLGRSHRRRRRAASGFRKIMFGDCTKTICNRGRS
jgi:hypothetical protein